MHFTNNDIDFKNNDRFDNGDGSHYIGIYNNCREDSSQSSPNLIFAQVNEKITTKLSVINQVPPKRTMDGCTAQCGPVQRLIISEIYIGFQNINKVTMSPIHQNKQVRSGLSQRYLRKKQYLLD